VSVAPVSSVSSTPVVAVTSPVSLVPLVSLTTSVAPVRPVSPVTTPLEPPVLVSVPEVVPGPLVGAVDVASDVPGPVLPVPLDEPVAEPAGLKQPHASAARSDRAMGGKRLITGGQSNAIPRP